jgi:hypothetical protein
MRARQRGQQQGWGVWACTHARQQHRTSNEGDGGHGQTRQVPERAWAHMPPHLSMPAFTLFAMQVLRHVGGSVDE